MSTYRYPNKVTDNNSKELFDRAEDILKKKRKVDFVAILALVVVMAAFVIPIVYYLQPVFSNTNEETVAISATLMSIGFSLFFATVVLQTLRVYTRRFSVYAKHYPKPEEYIFAECMTIAHRLLEHKCYDSRWFYSNKTATYQVSSLSEELLFFSRDLLNIRRKFYSPEFCSLARGTNQIERMLVFSRLKIPSLLMRFALALVNNDDQRAYRYLKQIIHETEQYGKLESLSRRIENQLRSWIGIVSLIGGIFALVGSILALISAVAG